MALTPYDFEEYREDIFTDELVKNSLDELQSVYQRMETWIRNNVDLKKCPVCEYKSLKYNHKGIECNRCGHFKKIKVPFKKGISPHRTLEAIIRVRFGRKMGRERANAKPSKNQIDKMPFKTETFDSGEYTKSQIDFLNKKYEILMEENRVNNEVDKFYVRSMAIRELEIMRLEKLRAVDMKEVGSQELKRQYSIYNDLSSKLKADKASRDDEHEQAFYDDMEEVLKNSNVQDIVKSFEKENKDKEKYLKKSKRRREKAGNKF